MSGSFETAKAKISSGLDGTTWSGHSDSMEKISLGVSHLAGGATAAVAEVALAHNRVTANARRSTGHRMRLDRLRVAAE